MNPHPIGKIAVEKGLINSAELKKILKGQSFFLQAGQSIRLGELMVNQEYISEEQLGDLLDRQQKLRAIRQP